MESDKWSKVLGWVDNAQTEELINQPAAACDSRQLGLKCSQSGQHASRSMKKNRSKPTAQALRRSLRELARVARVLALEGHEDITLGHVSMRDPAGRGLWIKRGGIGLGEVGAKDFQLIDFDGNLLQGKGERHNEWPIHAELLRTRPEIDFVGHTHADYIVLMSCLDEELRPYTHAAVFFDPIPPRFTQTSELITTPELGRALAAAVGGAAAAIIRNHGCCFVGRSVAELCTNGILLRQACEIQFKLSLSNARQVWPEAAEAARKRAALSVNASGVELYWNYYRRKLEQHEKRR